MAWRRLSGALSSSVSIGQPVADGSKTLNYGLTSAEDLTEHFLCVLIGSES